MKTLTINPTDLRGRHTTILYEYEDSNIHKKLELVVIYDDCIENKVNNTNFILTLFKVISVSNNNRLVYSGDDAEKAATAYNTMSV